ncbi:MAG TPA: hypothetical protein VLJ11_09695 [Bryobacteraceae bacterium]|nr:hypothetical protein [Bryobacteraceae bacterium]
MAGRNSVVYGIYSHRSQAEAGVDRLIGAGFRKEDISVLMQDNSGTKDFAHTKETKAPEGTTAGVIAGGAIGGTFGLLVGIGALAIPGLGPLIAAGPIIGALTGVGSGGVVGGIIGALIGMGIPEYEAKRFEGHIRKGGILASVHCDNSEWVSKAKSLLKQTGADDVSSSSEAKADFASSDRPYSTTESTNRRVTLGSLAERPPEPSPVPHDVPVRQSVAAPVQPASTPSRVRVVPTSGPATLSDEADFRRHFESGPGSLGRDYSAYAPAYHYGSEAASDAKYRGRSFDEIEPELRSEYLRRNPGSTWDQVKDSVRYGWSKISNRGSAARGTL